MFFCDCFSGCGIEVGVQHLFEPLQTFVVTVLLIRSAVK